MRGIELELLLNTLPGMAYRCAVEAPWPMHYVSPGVRFVSTLTPEDLTSGRISWGSIIHVDDVPGIESAVAEALEKKQHFSFTYRIADPVLGERWVSERGQAIYDDEGNATALVGFITDVTEQKRLEQRLRHSGDRHEAQLRTIVETVPVGLVMAELPSGRIIEGNKYVEQMLRHPVLYSPDVHSYDEWESYHADGTRVNGEEYPLARMVLNGEESPSIDVNYRRGDGTFAWTRIMGRPVRDATGHLVGGVVALVDIDDERKHWDQVQQQVETLQSQLIHSSRVSAMGTMASAIAHELNQPLTAVINYLRGALRLLEQHGQSLPANLSEALVQAEKNGVRAGEIIRRLREMLTHSELQVQEMKVAKLVEEAAALALIGTSAQGVVYSQKLKPSLCASVDPLQIQQVLINLIRNAVEATEASPKREVRVTASEAGGFVRISVADSGPGLAAEAAATLFEPFVSTKSSGMGVGLSICRTIVEAHGGKIWLDDAHDGGATFSFTLPAQAVKQ